ncbi:hypothetical protein HPB50_014525 [Hyalomma asiaticum]|uniref:Uncharacterized protein n=1 Tax=Hyalomma asiaticum TaxID=266040 RepID=A0ACB7T0G8_HYAAI|nr:hypothetical protein HPB50_014525 [Hyalomma asiaticum]
MEPIGRDLRDRNLKLLTADKEGFFVLLTEGQYEVKASASIAKNFKQANVKTQKVKEQAKKLLERLLLHKDARPFKLCPQLTPFLVTWYIYGHSNVSESHERATALLEIDPPS